MLINHTRQVLIYHITRSFIFPSDMILPLFSGYETNRNVRRKHWLSLNIPNYNQVTFGKKSLRIFGPKIWNSLLYHIKSSKNLEAFKTVIKNWDGVNCKCVIFKKLNCISICFHLSFIPYHSNIYTPNVCVVGFD